ncbi:Glycosyl transferase 4-like domain-containing protein [Dyadobacter sp. SG02]|uniref:hypothetical protein n=1 Tax=Dyadobacter sp. SG02 TaxID=1855291 RepID=UPI0008B13B28|nr:hypothetical protein [Dyadobacter sp. SG02]SEJ39078.1 Glycosyl transferase 4-like domain-containing protein [Dyadobacter sp. SG02]
MKILFICSSLEAGCDGVGDYTRRLSAELMRAGHEATIIALHDRHLLSDSEKRTQHDQGFGISVMRLSDRLSWRKKILAAAAYVHSAAPDWVSIQYVPYGFHRKGLPFGLGKSLKKIACGLPTHIMFHEIWVGITRMSPLAHKFYGFFQARIVRALISGLNPAIMTTSNRLYQLVLDTRHIQTDILPLFSNISLTAPDPAYEDLIYRTLGIDSYNRSHYTVIGLFGSLYPGCGLEQTIGKQYLISLAEGKKLAFIAFGRIGDLKEYERLKRHFAWQVTFANLGELPENEISTVMQMLDKAVSGTPVEHYGKSGVYAALKLHKLEVLDSVSNCIPEYESEIATYNHFLDKRDFQAWNADFVAHLFASLLHSKAPRA